ncbi:MAG: peptidylprolyl isomerase, partial [Actinomycetota bacterium]
AASPSGDTGDADSALDQASETANADAPLDVDESATVVTFNDATLTAAELAAFAAAIGADDTGALDLWLLMTAIEFDLAASGRPVTELDLADAELLVGAADDDPDANLIRANAIFAVARSVAEDVATGAVDPAAAPEVLCSSHILVDSEAEAIDVAALAQAGGDFAELAIEYSTGPSGPNGGDLGCVTTATFVPEFGDGARENGPGVTGPVQSQFGWHVIQVRSIGPGTLENHPELGEADVAGFLQEQIDTEAGRYLEELAAIANERVGAEAVIDPAYGAWDLELGQLVLS